MQFIISYFILVLALHFLLKGIKYRKKINIEQQEKFTVQEKKVECEEPMVVASNKYIDDKNDANFQSNVLNTNKFYQKNNDNPSDEVENSKEDENMNSFTEISEYSNQPVSWNYKEELVMNGGELIDGITGYDNLVDQYFMVETPKKTNEDCNPPTRGALNNDDIRMGLGKINENRRSIT